jgi:hypothetical protein
MFYSYTVRRVPLAGSPEKCWFTKRTKVQYLCIIPVMKCGCVFWEFAKRKLATRKDKMKIIKSLTQALSVSSKERCEMLACFHVVVQMYRYSLEERVFSVKAYWITGSIKNCQRMFVEEFGGRQAPRISPHDWLTTRAASSWLSLSYLFVMPTSFLRIHKTHNRTSLQVWHTSVLQFCSFCKPTFSGATREWDALYISFYSYRSGFTFSITLYQTKDYCLTMKAESHST